MKWICIITFHRFGNGFVQQFKDFVKHNDVLNRQLILRNRMFCNCNYQYHW